MKLLLEICPDFYDWPNRWMGQPADIQCGEKVLYVIKPFIEDLLLKGYNDKTIKRHIDNLWLLGGEIIRMVNMDSNLRKTQALDLILDNIGTDGGPYCRHLETDEELKSYDSTCRKLFRYFQL